MKFFHRRKDELFPRTGNSEHYLALAPEDTAYFAENDSALKFRVNETLERMIDEACAFLDVSASDFIRQSLFIYLYGRYRFLGMVERRPEFLMDRDAGLVLSQAISLPSSERPRNVADFKVWLPCRMKDDLQRLADTGQKPLSRYVREVVTLHLTGHADRLQAQSVPACRPTRKPQAKPK